MKEFYYCDGCEKGKLFQTNQTEDSIIDWDDVVKTTQEENDRTIREILTLPRIKICKQILNMKLFVIFMFLPILIFGAIFAYNKCESKYIENGFFAFITISVFIAYMCIDFKWTDKQINQIHDLKYYIKHGKSDDSDVNHL